MNKYRRCWEPRFLLWKKGDSNIVGRKLKNSVVMDLTEKFQDSLNNFNFQRSFLRSSNYLQRLAFHDFLKVFQKVEKIYLIEE